MTLGQRISQHRKQLGLSQEALGEQLGISRQAVSKWETNASTPDMENLLALARIFQISVAELTGTPEDTAPPSVESSQSYSVPLHHRFPSGLRTAVCGILLISLIGILLLTAWLNSPTVDPNKQSVQPPPPSEAPTDAEVSRPAAAPKSDFAFLWYGTNGDEEFLELGDQDALFPFGTTLELTEPEEILDTDFVGMTTHHADSGNISIDFYHIEEASGSSAHESIHSLSTMVSRVRTPRGVHVGSTKAQVLDAYGDELVYCLKESDGYTLVRHDYYYAFQTPETFGASLRFYMLDGIVAGIHAEHMEDMGNTAFAPNHISRFPVVNGEPDFSQRVEVKQEETNDTRKAYIAFNQLLTNNNLSTEEKYAYRRDVFALLPYIDLQAFGAMGRAAEHDDTVFALLDWLANQDSYSDADMLWIQSGAGNPGIDGAYAEMYGHILFRAFCSDPLHFAKALSTDGIEQETMYQVISLTAYSGDLYPNELRSALDTLESGIIDTNFTKSELGWVRLLHLYLTTDISHRSTLPHSPTELSPA